MLENTSLVDMIKNNKNWTLSNFKDNTNSPKEKREKKNMVENVVKGMLSALKRTSSVPGLNNLNGAGCSAKERQQNR